MRDTEQHSTQDDSAVEITDLQPQKEPAPTPVEKGTTTTGRQKLPRSWRYILIGGTVLLVLAVIFAGVLSLVNQRAKQSPVVRLTPTTVPTTPPTSTIGATTLPTPASNPIPAPALSVQNVNVTIAGGVAYLSTTLASDPSSQKNAVYALRTSNGALLWHQKIEGSADQAPLVANGVVYVTSYVGQSGPDYVYALRASDGSLLWRNSNANYVNLSLSTTDSSMIFVASQGQLSALNTSNGAVLWHLTTKDNSSGVPLEVNGVVYFSSSIDNGHGTFYALRASDGRSIWQTTTSGYTYMPVEINGVIYINSPGGTLVALRASDGHQLWKRALDATFIQSPLLDNGVLYIMTTKILEPPAAHSASPLQELTDIGALLWNTLQNVPAVHRMPQKEGISSIYAIRASDGAVLWHFAMNNGANSWASWFSVENGVVYASAVNPGGTSNTGNIYALQSSNGSLLWQDKLNTSPAGGLLANGVIYLSTSSDSVNGALYAVRTTDGSLLWNYPTSGSLFAAPVLDGNALYIGANNGMSYALRADNGAIMWHYLTRVGG
jgi:outer membrane protein assembly factor BamB